MDITSKIKKLLRIVFRLHLRSVLALLMLFGLIYFGSKVQNHISTIWIETAPVRVEIDKIQQRIREKQPEYFFKIRYYYHANDYEYFMTSDQGHRSLKEIQKQADTYQLPDNIKIWYDESDPGNIEVNEYHTLWHRFLIISGFCLLYLTYFGWIFLKRYKKD